MIPDSVKQELEEHSRLWSKLSEKLSQFAKELDELDLSDLGSISEKVEYKQYHKARKMKGGRPPRDYLVVEAKVDFQRMVSEGKYDEALPLYYYLRKHLGFAGRSTTQTEKEK